jgi:uncharacterized cupin superfamily protein
MCEKRQTPLAVTEAPPRLKPSIYPEPFASMMNGRVKHPLGELFGLKNFGVNVTRLTPGSVSALLHRHSAQDEFIYIISGSPVLRCQQGEHVTEHSLTAGMCMGFAAGDGNAHQLTNPGPEDVLYLEVGDRTASDTVFYPEDDLQAIAQPGGGWQFVRKDGTPY